IDILEASLATARFADDEEGPFVEYLRALFVKRQLDLVIAVGGPAASFFQRHRKELFPSIPALYMGLEERRVPQAGLTANDVVVANRNDFARSVDSFLRVLPQTSNIAVIIGNSPIEKYWMEQLRIAFQRFEGRVTFNYLNELSFEDMLKRAADLPPRSAIFFGLLSVDAAGIAHEEARAIARLHAVSNAPVFSYIDAFFGEGIVGGPMAVIANVGRQAAGVAVRVLAGEAPGSIQIPAIEFGAPKYDWRELKRWNISESLLPEGSQIDFRVPSLWEQYRPQMTAGLAALVLQAAIIASLLIERRRRQFAEAEASSRRQETVRLNRVATASVLSTSITHELNQPLGAILSNTEAAQILLRADPPDLTQIDEILSDIIRDEQRAGEIILGLRNLLNNRSQAELQTFDLNDTVRDVAGLVAREAAKRKIALKSDLTLTALPVRADPIHLQQVILNLALNSMDAIEDCESGPRNLTIRTRRNAESGTADVTVSDSGKGIPEHKLTSIFDAFYTTKPQGTGLGLPIARTIVETYGGTIWAENRDRGAVFSFRLPLAEAPAE
ncbi:MAG: sensor histidine kinase, partial [Candidatus Binatia bacterium]